MEDGYFGQGVARGRRCNFAGNFLPWQCMSVVWRLEYSRRVSSCLRVIFCPVVVVLPCRRFQTYLTGHDILYVSLAKPRRVKKLLSTPRALFGEEQEDGSHDNNIPELPRTRQHEI